MLIRDELRRALEEAWRNVAGSGDAAEMPAYTLEPPPPHVEADWSANLAFLAGKRLRRPPRELAGLLMKAMTEQAGAGGVRVLERVEVAGGGFLNLVVYPDRLRQELGTILERRDDYGVSTGGAGEPVVVELVSANPTGPLHVGHGRGAALADGLARLLRAAGYAVTTEYYVNDQGRQIDLLGRSLEARWRQARGQSGGIPEDGYQGRYLADVAAALGDAPLAIPEADRAAWFRREAIERILERIRDDLRRFGVAVDRWTFESALYREGVVDEALKALRAAGALEDKDGAVWFRSSSFGDEKDRVVVREDGRPTYLAADIAYHQRKLAGGRRAVDVWGADHHGYVSRLSGALKALGENPDRLQIILYQLVSLSRGGAPVPMSTRAGEFVTLREVVDEVGRDAARFFFLQRSANSGLEFDLDLARRQAPENPVFYVQYGYARICSVFREAEKQGVLVSVGADLQVGPPLHLLVEPEELALMRRLARFPVVVEACARDMAPHHIPEYLLDLVRAFHGYYDRFRVLGDDRELATARLALLDGVRTVLRRGLDLLGVSAPEHM